MIRDMLILEHRYQKVSEGTTINQTLPATGWGVYNLQLWLLEQATALVTNAGSLSVTDHLFQRGFDKFVLTLSLLRSFTHVLPCSLSAIFLRSRILAMMRASREVAARDAANTVAVSFVFENPSIRQLAYAIRALVFPKADSAHLEERDHLYAAEIKAMVNRYTVDLPMPTPGASQLSGPDPIVLLIGSTGSIGSHLLARMLLDDRICRVYALDRPSSVRPGRLKSSFTDQELSTGLLEDPKFVSLVGDVTMDNFGLNYYKYQEVYFILPSKIS